MEELPKKLKFANKNKTILTVKKHIHNYLKEPIDNVEILCKNFPVADSHSLEYIKKTKWQNSKVMVLQYKRKKRIIGHMNKQDWLLISLDYIKISFIISSMLKTVYCKGS